MTDAYARADTAVAPRAPFAVAPTFHRIDDQLNGMISRANGIRDRLIGSGPETNGTTQSVAVGPGSIDYVAETVEDKLRALSNLLVTIDNSI